VDVWEHRLRRGLPAVLGISAVVAIGGLTFKALKR
jgi:hypothetical protein